MLRKLLKYDLRELLRQTLPLIISMGAVSVVCCALLYFTMSFGEAENFFGALATTIGFFAIGIIAIAVMGVIIEFIAVIRYFKSLFTDEGYLNMVIPVKTSTLLFAKTLAVVIFAIVGGLALVVSLFISVGLPTILYDITYLDDIKEVLSLFIQMTDGIEISSVLTVITILVEFLYSTVALLSAITVGSVLLRRHKLLGTVIFVFAFSLIKSVLEALISGGIFLVLSDSVDYSVHYAIETVVTTLISLAFGTALYLINLRTLERKFNIE
ncbi:MAG: hypothetical protein IJY01_02555 [Clostridia bacterium]|nr:hypothetical protein [Clostridia bacterium]MBQ8289734.1 hypothetical protein [Clostridia bacterium]